MAWPWGHLLIDQTLKGLHSSMIWTGAVFLSIIKSQWHNFSLSQGHGGRLWKGRRQNTMIKSPTDVERRTWGKRFRNKNTLNETDKTWKRTKSNRSRALDRSFKTQGLNTTSIQILFYKWNIFRFYLIYKLVKYFIFLYLFN